MKLIIDFLKISILNSFLLSIAFSPLAKAETSTANSIYAIVNSHLISKVDVDSELNILLKKDSSFIEKVNTDEGKSKWIKTIINRIADDLIVSDEAKKIGLDASDKDIDYTINNIMKSNNISKDQLVVFLGQEGKSYEKYRREIKLQVEKYKLTNKIIRPKVSITDIDLEDYYKKNYLNENKRQLVKFQSIFISKKERDASEIKKRIETIKKAVKQSDVNDFEKLVLKFSDSDNVASTKGILKGIKLDELAPSFKDAFQKMNIGELSGLIEAKNGYYFAKLLDIYSEATEPFEEVKETISNVLMQERMEKRFNMWLQEVRAKSHIDIRYGS
ncbi:MAG: peptidylprolyl isomerase [Pseudomonadota bacterium]